MEGIKRLTHHTGKAIGLDELFTDQLFTSVCYAGPGPLCGLCLELWGRHQKETRWLPHAVVAALMTRSAAEVYDEFSPYVLTIKPLALTGGQKQYFHNAVLRGLGRLTRDEDTGAYFIENTWPTAQPLDKRWLKRLTKAVWKTTGDRQKRLANAYTVEGSLVVRE